MRFYEYEARKIVELAGIPVTKYGFCQTADEAHRGAAEPPPDPVGPAPLPNLLPISDFEAKQAIAATGVTGSQLNRATPILARLGGLFRDNDMTPAAPHPLGE